MRHACRSVLIRRWAAPACLVASLVGLGGCQWMTYEHAVEVSVLDPARRLGPPPWKAYAFTGVPPEGAGADWILAHGLALSPTEPPVLGVRASGQRWLWDFSVPGYAHFNMFFPSLWSDGWWAATVSRQADGQWDGIARFVRFGEELVAGSKANPGLALSARVSGRAEARSPDTRRGWNLKVTVEIRHPAN